MEEILSYIRRTYNPQSILVYGSYANGTNNLNSDFDVLVISRDHPRFHDTSFVHGVQLDCFVYPAAYFEGDFDCEDFVQIFDGKILLDHENVGKNLQDQLRAYLQRRCKKSREELLSEIDWCRKMRARAARGDAEGLFRWHWVLIDSLEIFCDILRHPYLGPKKALRWMEADHPDAFACYQRALQSLDLARLEDWVACIEGAGEAL